MNLVATWLTDLGTLIDQLLRSDLVGLRPAQDDWTWSLVLALVILVATSTLVGHAVVLAANRVHGIGVLVSSLLNALYAVASTVAQSLVLWVIAYWALPDPPSMQLTLWVVAVASAPRLFQFLELVPWIGTWLGRLTEVWSFVLLWQVVAVFLNTGALVGLLLAGAAWVATYLFSQLGRTPLGRLLESVWFRITGRDLYHNSREVLLRSVLSDEPEPLNQRLDDPLRVDGTLVRPDAPAPDAPDVKPEEER